MKVTFLFFFFLFTGLFAKAQTNLDSLHSVWEDKTQLDSSRVDAFTDYINKGYLYSQPDSALVLANQLLEFSSKNDYKKGMSSALTLLGNGYYIKSDFHKALNFFQRGLKISEEIGNKKGVAGYLGGIGSVYYSLDYYPKALNYYQRSLKIKEEIGNKLSAAYSLHNIGNVYYSLDDYPKALNYYQRSLKIKEEADDKRGMTGSLNNIGNIYDNQGDYPRALVYYQRGLKISEEIGDQWKISMALSNIGGVYNNQGDYPRALVYYQRGLKIGEEIGNKLGIAEDLHSIGGTYIKLGDFLNAIKNCHKSFILSKLIESIIVQRNSCSCLYKAYKAQSNTNKALFYHEQMLVLNDSLQTEETANKLQQMEFAKQVLADSLAQLEQDMKVEMAHQAEVQQKDKNRNLAYGAGIFLLFIAVGFFSRSRYIKKSRDVISKEKDRSENLLLNILPAEIAEELKSKGKADARNFDNVSILFTDFQSFTEASTKLSAQDLVSEINVCFEVFDGIMGKYGIEKIKTIGDAYMAAGGLPVPSEDSLKNTVLAALEMQAFISKRKVEMDTLGKHSFQMRAGIHTGSVVAGIVGVKKFQYDIWGDAVNIASRMESNGQVGKVNISKQTYELIKDDEQFTFKKRGKIQAKGKGEIEMYFVELSSNG